MSASDRATVPFGGVSAGDGAAHRVRRAGSARTRESVARRLDVSQWTGWGWGAIGATVAFVAMTCWWLTQDRSIPIYDAGAHLVTAFEFHDMLASGNLLGPLTVASVYPPLVHTIGGVATLIGGVNVASPIIASNLIFVPLLALGCYQTGRFLFGSQAGLFAVLCVLASPLLIEQFHVFMLDAPMTALVAVSIWLILASEDFSRTDVAAAAGVAAGVGMLTKVQFPLYVGGLVIVLLARGGWRNRRGLVAFFVLAAVIGLPWYIGHIAEFSRITEIAGTGAGADVPPGNAPPTLTSTNFLWYFWSVMNSQLLVPLFALALGGSVWILAAYARNRERHGARFELLAAAVLAWFINTLTPHHDIRYGMELVVYAAVIATGWIVCLPTAARRLCIAILLVGVAANTLGLTFGVGSEVKLALAHPPPSTQQIPDQMIFYARQGFLTAGPIRDGDIPGLFSSFRRDGVSTVAVNFEQSRLPDFSFEGIEPLAREAGLKFSITRSLEFVRSPQVVTIIHEPVAAQALPVCTRVSDGTGVWFARYDLAAGKLALYCPYRTPRFYAIGRVR